MALTATDKCGQIKKLRNFASSLRGAVERWSEKYGSDSHCDKKSFCFKYGKTDRSTAAFTATVHLESYAGYYGNSSVSRVYSFEQTFIDRYFAAALNQHKQSIFDSMAALAERDAAEMVSDAREEVALLQALLEDAEGKPALAEQVSA